jgi:Flp pilus assembly protein TadG
MTTQSAQSPLVRRRPSFPLVEESHQDSGQRADKNVMNGYFRPTFDGRPQNTVQIGRRDRGVVLLVFTAMVFGVVGICGLAIDLGQMYVAKGELQNYTDAAALAAALKLDGTINGIDQAKLDALNNVNTWKFGTAAASNVTVEFSTAVDGTYVENPFTGADYRFARVTAYEDVDMTFLPLIPGVGASRGVAASSTSGQMMLAAVGDGVIPF